MKKRTLIIVLGFISFFALTTSTMAASERDKILAENDILKNRNTALTHDYMLYMIQVKSACDSLKSVLNLPADVDNLVHGEGEIYEELVMLALNKMESGEVAESIKILQATIEVNQARAKEYLEIRKSFANKNNKRETPIKNNLYKELEFTEIKTKSSDIPDSLIEENKELRRINRNLVARCTFITQAINDLCEYKHKSLDMALSSLDSLIAASGNITGVLAAAIQVNEKNPKLSATLLQNALKMCSLSKNFGAESKKISLSFQKDVQDFINKINSVIQK